MFGIFKKEDKNVQSKSVSNIVDENEKKFVENNEEYDFLCNCCGKNYVTVTKTTYTSDRANESYKAEEQLKGGIIEMDVVICNECLGEKPSSDKKEILWTYGKVNSLRNKELEIEEEMSKNVENMNVVKEDAQKRMNEIKIEAEEKMSEIRQQNDELGSNISDINKMIEGYTQHYNEIVAKFNKKTQETSENNEGKLEIQE